MLPGQLEVRDAAAVAALIVVADDDENCTVVGSIHRDVMFHRRLVSLAISGQ
ncbi:MAG: hypothetical protein KME13_09505 [Myxacorys californica WJT36-NPBG1]|nr:hypothetical protein [Myxacorys californica WJT36-NPBG1]